MAMADGRAIIITWPEDVIMQSRERYAAATGGDAVTIPLTRQRNRARCDQHRPEGPVPPR